ncbi:MAG TPA: hypothetical protein DDX91_10235 [Ruminococcaceae bacterium]|nr:hypothetical protein [Oscillospiraceae bacterium]
MDYSEMAVKIKRLCDGVELKDYQKRMIVQVNVRDGGDGSFYIDVNQGKVAVEMGKAEISDIDITASSETLIGLARGDLDPKKTFLAGKISFKGSISKVLEFKKIIDKIKAARAEKDKAAV